METGSLVLDEFLEGGYEDDVITTIYGPPGSGKTNFCLIAMTACQKKILYVDTEGSFSLSRFKQITDKYEEILNRTIFLNPTTYNEQRESFEFLRKNITDDFGLIIIDSIAALYRLELGVSSDVANVNRELSNHMAILTEIARKKNIPVIMTNQVYANLEDREGIKAVGGDVIKYWSRALIEVQKTRTDLRKLILIKHRSIKEGKTITFKIIREGIEEIKS